MLIPTRFAPKLSFTPVSSPVLQRACACGQHTGGGGACAACREKREGTLQRAAVQPSSASAVPPLVHDVLRSPGQPLDTATRAFMEPRFGQDFSQVRVHSDAKAAESARTVHALAYTVGQDVVLGSGQYQPQTTEGRHLMAHELTHVVQQTSAAASQSRDGLRIGAPNLPQEQEAEAVSREVASVDARPSPISISRSANAVVQRQGTEFPGPSPRLGQINLTIDSQGKVSITVVGPENTPVVKQPTIGIRRDPDGKYHLLVGSKDTIVSVNEIPDILRRAVGQAGRPGRPSGVPTLRVPTCSQLTTLDGTRFKTYTEHQADFILNPNWLRLSPAMYQALVESCQPDKPAPPPAEPEEALPPVVPEGMAVA